jgi:hypothetical protein
VLVSSGQKEGFASFLALPSSENIRGHLCVGVADVWGVIDVKDWRRDIKRLSRWANAGHENKLNRADPTIDA